MLYADSLYFLSSPQYHVHITCTHEYHSRLNIQETRISLLRIVEYYNFVREQTEKCEFDIIYGEIEVIEAELTALLENFTWINFGTYLHLGYSFHSFKPHSLLINFKSNQLQLAPVADNFFGCIVDHFCRRVVCSV